MASSGRRPFKEVEAERAPFDASLSSGFAISKTASPAWHAGQGTNDAHGSNLKDEKHHYKVVVPGQTAIEPMSMYKLLLGGISPRPIALVSTQSKSGQINMCPVSWYQMVSHHPPLVMVSFGGDQNRRKDSELNVEETGEFTISSCSEPYAEALNYASVEAPRGVSEYALTGLTPVASRLVAPPRVKEAPFSLECRVDFRREYYADGSGATAQAHDPQQAKDHGGMTTVVIIAKIVAIHMREDCLLPDGSVNIAKTLPVNRVSGMLYTRATHGFELPRPRWDDIKDTEEVRAALQREVAVQPPDFDDPVLASFP